MKVTEDFPAGTVTDAGTPAIELLELDSCTTKPPAGRGPLNVTVPTTRVPELPVTVDGVKETAVRTGGFTVKVALSDPEGNVPVNVSYVRPATAFVLIAN